MNGPQWTGLFLPDEGEILYTIYHACRLVVIVVYQLDFLHGLQVVRFKEIVLLIPFLQ